MSIGQSSFKMTNSHFESRKSQILGSNKYFGEKVVNRNDILRNSSLKHRPGQNNLEVGEEVPRVSPSRNPAEGAKADKNGQQPTKPSTVAAAAGAQ